MKQSYKPPAGSRKRSTPQRGKAAEQGKQAASGGEGLSE